MRLNPEKLNAAKLHPEFKRLLKKQLSLPWIFLIIFSVAVLWSSGAPELQPKSINVPNFEQKDQKEYSYVYVETFEECVEHFKKHTQSRVDQARVDLIQKDCKQLYQYEYFDDYTDRISVLITILAFVVLGLTIAAYNNDAVNNVWDYQRLSQWPPRQLALSKILAGNAIVWFFMAVITIIYIYAGFRFATVSLALANVWVIVCAVVCVASGTSMLYTFQLRQNRQPTIGLIWIAAMALGLLLAALATAIVKVTGANLLDINFVSYSVNKRPLYFTYAEFQALFIYTVSALGLLFIAMEYMQSYFKKTSNRNIYILVFGLVAFWQICIASLEDLKSLFMVAQIALTSYALALVVLQNKSYTFYLKQKSPPEWLVYFGISFFLGVFSLSVPQGEQTLTIAKDLLNLLKYNTVFGMVDIYVMLLMNVLILHLFCFYRKEAKGEWQGLAAIAILYRFIPASPIINLGGLIVAAAILAYQYKLISTKKGIM